MVVPPFTLDTSKNLSEETQKIAEEELRETPENVEKGLKELKELLAKDEDIFFPVNDDDILKVFLRPCKYYAESAHKLMKGIADFKLKYKDQLKDLQPNDEKDAFINHNVVNVLKERDHKGRRVLIVNCGGSWDTSKVSADQLFRIFYLIHIAATLEPETQVRGAVVIMDFNGLSFSQIKAMSPAFSMKLMGFLQTAMPLRLKEIHMVKEPFIFNMVWKIFTPFIEKKLKSRIFFHGKKMSSLHKYMEKTHLPSDYDGELHKIDYSGADWFPCIDGFDEYFKECNTWGLKKKN